MILSIETATSICSVALHRNYQLLGSQTLMLEKSHSTHLAVMINQLLENCQVSMSELEAVAISKGPGSYTGLRIGLSTAKGLCYALDVPLIGVNTLKAMAYQLVDVPMQVDFYCPMIDARRMEVYCMVLDKRFNVINDSWAQVVNKDSFDQWTKQGSMVFFGNGSQKCKEVLTGSNMLFMDNLLPVADSVGLLAGERFKQERFEDLAYFEPYYLKEYRTTVPKTKVITTNGG